MLSHSMPVLGRARGALLRLVRRRSLSILLGLGLAVPAAWTELASIDVPWWVEGLSLVAGATGLALFWSGLRGPSPDWIEH
jgi:hypothetical protein